MLHAMSFEEILVHDMVLLGRPETVTSAIRRLAGQPDLMGLALIFKLRAMLYDMVERWMTLFGAKVVARIAHLLDHNVAGNRVATKPARRIV